jgi:hypothetical protein
MQQFPSISKIDVWMADKNQPWSQYALRHQICGHVEELLAELKPLLEQPEDTELATHENKFDEVQASEYLSDEQKSPPDLQCIGDRFFAESHSKIEPEQQKEIAEETALEDVSGLAMKLANSQIKHGEFTPPTLRKEFELAKGLEGMGQYEEAEYHCRRILDRHSQVDVEAFLGTILAKTLRCEEAMSLLFCALTGFIIQFIQTSLSGNARLFAPIEALFLELLLQSEQGFPSLTDRWCLMMDTLRKPTSDGDIYQICPQLFLHGFSLAHECLALGLIDSDQYLLDSAACLYRYLLEHSSRHLDVVNHAIEKAMAHRGYARLLRKEKKWIPSAKQLLFACKSALHSATPDRELIVLLERDYHKLLPHLNCEPYEEGFLKESIERALVGIRGLSPFPMQHISEPVQGSHVEEYLLSSDLPIHMITLEPSAISHVSRFGFSLGITSSAHGGKDRTSTASVAASTSCMSHHWGKTFSAGENCGLGMVF